LYVEGETDKIILENAYKILYQDKKANFKIISLDGADNFRYLANLGKITESSTKMSIFLNDYDQKGLSVYKQIKQNKNKDLENYSTDNFLIKRSDDKKIWTMLLPVPESRKSYVSELDLGYLTIELLFNDTILEKYKETVLSFYTEKTIYNNKIYKITDNTASKITFANKTKDFAAEDFTNFKPLFEKIEEILKL
jgi:hypothetical protein